VKIAFVSGNRETLPSAVIPIGLLYIMASTPDRHEKTLIDLCFEEDPLTALRYKLEAMKPDLIAISMRNIQNNDYSGISDNLANYAELIDSARIASSAPIVLGGSGFSVMSRELMEHLKPDFGISGEGERAFPQLVSALENGGLGLDSIGALLHWNSDALVVNPRPPDFLNMSQLPFPDRALVDPYYYEEYGVDSIQTKRGCPLRCDYCTYPLVEGRKGRLRKAESVVDEMFAALEAQPSLNHFFVVDSVFNLPKRHAKRVCRELIRRDWQTPWSCNANPLDFDEELAQLAHEAGCAGMEIGSDSGCDRVLERLKKGFTVGHIHRMHAICRAAGVPDCHAFIVGTEGETIDDVRETIDFIVKLDPYSAIINVWFDDHEALDPELRKQRMKLRTEIEALLLDHKNDYPHWTIPALGVNFDEDLLRKLRRIGRHGPLWQHLRNPAKWSHQASTV
jgi:radical SAM superfamily enzyme YgiQ (UPF0313 family)